MGLSQAVGRDGMVVVAVGGPDAPASLLTPAKALSIHQASHTVTPMTLTLLLEFSDDARAALGLAAVRMNGPNLLGQLLVLEGSRPRCFAPSKPSVITALGHLEVRAKQVDGMVAFHRLNPGVTLGDGSERMPNVFFRISRCSLR